MTFKKHFIQNFKLRLVIFRKHLIHIKGIAKYSFKRMVTIFGAL